MTALAAEQEEGKTYLLAERPTTLYRPKKGYVLTLPEWVNTDRNPDMSNRALSSWQAKDIATVVRN